VCSMVALIATGAGRDLVWGSAKVAPNVTARRAPGRATAGLTVPQTRDEPMHGLHLSFRKVPGSRAFRSASPQGQRLSRSLSSETLVRSGADERGGPIQELLLDGVGIGRFDACAHRQLHDGGGRIGHVHHLR
jgi:hypothetical protein